MDAKQPFEARWSKYAPTLQLRGTQNLRLGYVLLDVARLAAERETCFERISLAPVASAVFASASTPQPSPSMRRFVFYTCTRNAGVTINGIVSAIAHTTNTSTHHHAMLHRHGEEERFEASDNGVKEAWPNKVSLTVDMVRLLHANWMPFNWHGVHLTAAGSSATAMCLSHPFHRAIRSRALRSSAGSGTYRRILTPPTP
jgi:hypothetical protein